MARVVIVTNGNAFARLFLTPLLERHADDIAAVHLVTGIREDAGRVRSILRYLRRSGPGYVLYKAGTYLVPAALGALRIVRAPFVGPLARSLGIPTRTIASPNGTELAAELATDPDTLLVSVSCPMRIEGSVLAAAGLGAVNVHSSPLPAYAGLAPYVWVLTDGCTETAVTVHRMDERLDTGDVIAAPRIAIAGPTSVAALFLEMADVGGRALRDVVGATLASAHPVAGRVQDPAQRSYRGMPTRACVRGLRAHGHRLVRGGDVRRYVRAVGASTSDVSTARSPA